MLRTRIFAVAGNPVLHSRSPDMFNSAFRVIPIDAIYTRLAPSNTEEIVKSAKEVGIAGLNITSPFKEEIMRFLNNVEDNARKIGAVNTIVIERGKFIGYNTDIIGVRDALLVNGVDLRGKKAVVMGAGGAARAAIFALQTEGTDVVISNRTFEKAKKIAEALGCRASKMENLDGELENTDMLISCIPSTERMVNPHLLRKELVILDANYGAESLLVRDAKKRGCKIIDGREWLLFQGAAAFKHFTGLDAPLKVMRKALYTEHGIKKRNIALIGFMGTGKSEVVYRLEEKTGMLSFDVDKEIEGKTGCLIREIFEHKGERAFRRMERGEIEKIKGISNAVIATGGGAVLSRMNRNILKKNCIVIWLWANRDTILKRVDGNGIRPLLNVKNKRRQIERILKVRVPLYAHASDLLIRADERSPEEIAERIYNESNKSFKN